MKCNISAWCRQTLTDHAKKRIAGFGLLCTLLLAGILSSCTDDEFPEARMNAMQTRSVCNIYITDAEMTNAIDGQGGISISGLSDPANIINSNHNDYATYVGILDLATSKPLVALTTHNKIPTGNGMRVGFEVQALTGLLDLSVLDAYEIKVYDGDKLVKSSNTEGHTVNVGVLNFDNSRVRLSVNIGSGKQFDHIELWLKSVAGLANTQKIYNVFYESTDCPEESVNEACMEVLTNAKHNLRIDDDHTNIGSIVSIGGGLRNVENMLDGSLDTYATCGGIDVGSNNTISLKFDEQPANQPIGIVLSDGNGILDADILSKITLNVYQKNDETAIASKSDFTTVNADLISKNGKTYLEIPGADIHQPYNRIELVYTNLISLGSLHIRGVYTRVDSDGDGIPDCPETSGVLTLTGGITHLCEGNAALIPVESTALPGGSELSLAWTNRDNEKTGTADCTLSEDKDGKFLRVDGAESWEEGRYYVDIFQEGKLLWNHAEVYVHPKQTTWKPQDNSTDWNRWENWDNGSPWECTDVILPSGASIYPILEDGAENRCHNLYFAPRSELENTPAFSANNPNGKVFVDTEVNGGNYSLFSAPLSGMVTGDMFVSSGPSNHFATLDENSYPERRVSPMVYQRFWSKTVEMATPGSGGTASNTKVTIDRTDWSKTFNAVNTVYDAAQGFSVRPGREGESGSYTFRFPKEHTTYHYFYSNGTSTGQSATIDRNGQAGQFIQKTFGPVNLTIDKSGTRFLFGNPFMTHLDIKKFLEANQSNVSAVEVYDGTQYVAISCNDQGNLISTLEETPTMVAPMEAVFVQAKNEGKSLSLNLTREMFHLKGKSSLTRASRSGYAHSKGSLRMKATVSGESSSCILLCSSRYVDAYRASEDITALIDNDVKPAVAIFTVADRKALSIQRMRSATRIPVGFYLKRTGNVSLAFDASDNIWSGWRLKDKQTGRSYPLKGRITLHNVSTGSGRFFLEKVK